MFNPERYNKRKTDISKPSQNFDNFFGGGYYSDNLPKPMPAYKIEPNPYVLEIEQLKRKLKERDEEIIKLRVKNESLAEELSDAKEKLSKGQFLKSQSPFGHASPHPPYGNISMTADISYTRYPQHGTEASKKLNHKAREQAAREQSDMMLAKFMQEQFDAENAELALADIQDQKIFQTHAHPQTSPSNSHRLGQRSHSSYNLTGSRISNVKINNRRPY